MWIVPDVAIAKRLQSIMNVRPLGYDAVQKGSSEQKNVSYPTFYPHITLASIPDSMADELETIGIALPPKRAEPSGVTPSNADPSPSKPIICKFAALTVGDVYHRSVYIAVALSERQSPGLAALHAQVHEKLGIPTKTPAFPHMSLVYIDQGDAEDENGAESKAERKRYHDTLVSRNIWKVMDGQADTDTDLQFGLSASVASDGAVVENESDSSPEYIDHFVAHEIWAVRCDGPVEEWVVLRRWSL